MDTLRRHWGVGCLVIDDSEASRLFMPVNAVNPAGDLHAVKQGIDCELRAQNLPPVPDQFRLGPGRCRKPLSDRVKLDHKLQGGAGSIALGCSSVKFRQQTVFYCFGIVRRSYRLVSSNGLQRLMGEGAEIHGIHLFLEIVLMRHFEDVFQVKTERTGEILFERGDC